jgi:AmmeMemoRadiSam system protein A
VTGAADRALLLKLARDAVVAHAAGLPAPALAMTGALAERAGVFVTLHGADGSLRGCIGHIEGDEPLGRVIARCAVSAASEDPRFSAVGVGEVATLQIELSVLGPLEAIRGPSDIEIGRHGVLVERGRTRGLLLPQVATEWNWDAETFLTQTCRKAGLPGDAWKRDATLWRFEAEVFGEGDRPG